MVVDGADAGGRPDEWPELWLYDREADITRARKLAEAQATWREYQPLLHALSAGSLRQPDGPTHTPFKVVDPCAISEEGDHGGPCRSQRVLSQPHRSA